MWWHSVSSAWYSFICTISHHMSNQSWMCNVANGYQYSLWSSDFFGYWSMICILLLVWRFILWRWHAQMDRGLRSIVATENSSPFITLWYSFSHQMCREIFSRRMLYYHHFLVREPMHSIAIIDVFFFFFMHTIGIENVLMKSHLKSINKYCQV